MAYTTIDNPELYFQTVLWSGDSTSPRTITFDGSEDMQPDWIWSKKRSGADYGQIYDSVRGFGASKELVPSDAFEEGNATNSSVGLGFISSVTSDGFVLTEGNHGTSSIRSLLLNHSGSTHVGWGWAAGGSAPAITYSVKVVSDSGNKYRFDDFGTSAVTLDLQEGGTYTFDQSDSSNSGHPLRFYTAADKSGGEYTTGVTTSGTAGSAGAKTIITVAASAPTLYYQCSSHSAMGGQANTNSTHGSSNFSGSIQSVASANTTAGFSIVSYTGTSSNATVGHGLGAVPEMMIIKKRSESTGSNWIVYHVATSNTGDGHMWWDLDNARSTDTNSWNNTIPTSSVFSLGTRVENNDNSETFIAYLFKSVQGFSKVSKYRGNNQTGNNAPFIYTGFKISFLMVKKYSNTNHWIIWDNKRSTKNGFNIIDKKLYGNLNNAENGADDVSFLSNGFKLNTNTGDWNEEEDYLYMAFAENPFVTSSGVPTTAR